MGTTAHVSIVMKRSVRGAGCPWIRQRCRYVDEFVSFLFRPEQLLSASHELPNRQTASMSDSLSVSKSDRMPDGDIDRLDSLLERIDDLERNRKDA